MPLPNNLRQHLSPIAVERQAVLSDHLAFCRVRGFGEAHYDALVESATDSVAGLCTEFLAAVRQQRYASAKRITRSVLDLCVRLHACASTGDREEFAGKVEGGTPLNELKDSEGNPLQDRRLMDSLVSDRDIDSEEEAWLRGLYRETSGFVHFSDGQISITRNWWQKRDGARGDLVQGRAEEEVEPERWEDAKEDFLGCVRLFLRVLGDCLKNESSAD